MQVKSYLYFALPILWKQAHR